MASISGAYKITAATYKANAGAAEVISTTPFFPMLANETIFIHLMQQAPIKLLMRVLFVLPPAMMMEHGR